MNVLIVDDSIVIRSVLKQAIHTISPGYTSQSASNGKIALQMLQQKTFDLVILDINMPEMGGLATLAEIRRKNIDVEVIVFASQTPQSVRDTMIALKQGALDFILKPTLANTPSEAINVVAALFRPLVQMIERTKRHKIKQDDTPQTATQAYTPKPAVNVAPPAIAVVASSTGGPSALEILFSKFSHIPKIPVLVVQHMPPIFTQHLAKRIEQYCNVPCKEAASGDLVQPGQIYIAPGDYHMQLVSKNNDVQIALDQEAKICSVRPAADKLFTTAAKIYGNQTLGIVLTGMGADGTNGAIDIKNSGGRVFIQDEESSVVWGMAGSVHNIGAYDHIDSLENLSSIFANIAIERKYNETLWKISA